MNTATTISANTTSAALPIRTAAVARAQRAARAAQKPRSGVLVTDRDTDALLPSYDLADEFPALSARNLSRREDRDAQRGITCWSTGACDANSANVNDANFNRIAPPVAISRAAVSDMTAREIDRILAALNLSEDLEDIVRLRLDNLSLQEIADRYQTNKQTIARRIDAAGKKLALFSYDDKRRGVDEVYESAVCRHIYHGLSRGHSVAAASVCQCASHQFRVQRVKGQEGEFTWHCENCKKKYDKQGFDALRQGGSVLWGN